MGLSVSVAPFLWLDLTSTDGQNHKMQVARIPTFRSPSARAVPYGVTNSRRKNYSVVLPPRSLIAPRPTIITVCLPRRGKITILDIFQSCWWLAVALDAIDRYTGYE